MTATIPDPSALIWVYKSFRSWIALGLAEETLTSGMPKGEDMDKTS
jgi:hypothetical protein